MSTILLVHHNNPNDGNNSDGTSIYHIEYPLIITFSNASEFLVYTDKELTKVLENYWHGVDEGAEFDFWIIESSIKHEMINSIIW